MITSVIIDDETKSRQVLKSLLREFKDQLVVSGEAAGVNEGCKLIRDIRPQLVFLDIQMPLGGGFSLLEQFPEPEFEVIFVTSYDQHAIRAIKFSALDYLLKPVDSKELEVTIQKACGKIARRQDSRVKIINLLAGLDDNDQARRAAFHIGDSVRFHGAAEISHIEAMGPYSLVFLNTGEKLTASKTLKDFEEFFQINGCFIRASKSTLVNVNQVKEYSKGYYFTITMKNGFHLEVSRRKKTEIITLLKGESGLGNNLFSSDRI